MRLIFFIIVILISTFSFTQECANLYIKEHLQGDPICSYGKYVKICLDENYIEANNRTYYIKKSGQTDENTMYFELSMDKGYGWPTVGELLVNTVMQRLSLTIHNNSGVYSYFNQTEMKKVEVERQIEMKKLEQERIELNKKEEKEKKEKEIENKLKDNSLLILIKDHLNQKRTNLALETYNNLNLTASQQEVRGLLETSLIEYYKQNPKEISKSELNEFIRKYNTVFKTVNPGNHTLKIDTDGSIFIDDKIINQKSEIFRMNVGNDLTIPYVTKANFELIQKQEFGGEERFETSTTRKVSKTKRGDYYKVSFFTYSIFSFPVTKTINENIPKNSYNVVQPIIESKFINDNFISKENTVKVIKQGQFKKRIGVAIRRSIVSAFVIVWSSLRIYEMSLIPV